jgi:hypothetical protein
MPNKINTQARAAHRLLKTAFLNRPIDVGPARRRASVERYWLEQMASADAKVQGSATAQSASNDDQIREASLS